MRTIVLGAGVAGVTTAYFLAGLGHEVEVIERRAAAGEEASFANGGVMGFTQIEPWANPQLPRKLPGWIGRSHAPIAIGWGEAARHWRWGLSFLSNCTEAAFRRNLAANARLTAFSRQAHTAFRQQTALSYDWRQPGALKVFATRAGLDQARRRLELVDPAGREHKVVDAEGCVASEPALGAGVRAGAIVGGIHFPAEEVGDCCGFTRALAQACARMGVRFAYGTTVRRLRAAKNAVAGVETDHGLRTADRYVVALASATPLATRTVGLAVPIRPVKGVSITVPATGAAGEIRGAIMDHSRLFGLIRIGDRLRLSGLARFTGYDASPEPARAQAMIDAAVGLFPHLRDAFEGARSRSWAGLRGLTPDGRPILGATPLSNLFLNAGHGPQGWSTAFGCALAVARLVAGEDLGIDLADFALARFGQRD